MASYSYKAKTPSGETVAGVLTAESQPAALRMLNDRALFPITVSEGSTTTKNVITGGRRKVKLRQMATLYSQMSDLLKAGVPVLRSLDTLSRTASNPLLAQILKEVHNDVSGGATLADALSKHPAAFSELTVAMVRAGEQGGFLEDVLARVSVFVERQDELRNKLIGSMIYPCILLGAGVTVVAGLMIFVVPRIRTFLERMPNLPWLTRALFGTCDFLQANGVYLLGAVVLGVVLAIPALRSEQGREYLDRFKLRAPVMGGIVTMVAVCRFCRILGTMLSNGVPILQALRIGKDSAGNRILAAEIDKAAESVQKGESLAVPLGASRMFPPEVIDMIAVAEESNNLDNVLVQIADSNEARTARQIDLGVRLLEPIMLLVMAVFVLVIAGALLVPILKMSTMGR
ncbi:MAG TPA: type II secretion system F family protein [Phycisphaerae bacterium]|nr:type II secretion system F family protein [Phycisphaerae bacterium]